MDEIYYVDRPPVPATRQVVVKIHALFEDALWIHSQDISSGYSGYVVEVKNSRGENDGTLVYFPGLTYEELTRVSDTESTAGDASDDVIPEPIHDGPVVSERDEEADVLDDIRVDTILDLELELAVAKQHVQYLEDELAYEEGARD